MIVSVSLTIWKGLAELRQRIVKSAFITASNVGPASFDSSHFANSTAAVDNDSPCCL